MLHLLRSSGTLNKLAQVLIFALLTTSMVLIPAESEQAQANTSYGYNSTVDYAATVSDGAFVSGANEAVIPASDNTFTVDGWFYLRPGTSDGDDYQTLFAQNQDTGGCRAGRLFVSAHWTGSQYDLHAAQNSCGDFFSLGVIPTNTWFHLAYVSDNSQYRVYLNGDLIHSSNQSMASVTSDRAGFAVGGSWDGANVFHDFPGMVDEIRVWSGANTQNQIQTYMRWWGSAGVAGLIHHYDFNEGNGGTVYDRVGSINLTSRGVYSRTSLQMSAPLNVSVSPGVESISVTWGDTLETYGRNIHSYRVEYSTDGTNWTNQQVYGGTQRGVTITGLSSAQSYFVRVAAQNNNTSYGFYGYPWTKIFATTNPRRTSGLINYDSGFGLAGGAAEQHAASNFTRIRYRVQAAYGLSTTDNQTSYVDVNFSRNIGQLGSQSETYSDIAKLQMPSTAGSGSQFEIQGNVQDVNVTSNIAAQNSRYISAARLEIWPWNYATAPDPSLTARGPSTQYDDADSYTSGNGVYASFQIHNLDQPATIVAWNRQSEIAPEIGFGNYSGVHSDWTFAANDSPWSARTDFKWESFANVATTPQSSTKITFFANNGTSVTTSQTIIPNQAATLTANSFVRSGHAFMGWTTQADGSGTKYRNQQSVTFASSTSLYALWASLSPQLNLNSTDLNSFDPQTGVIRDLSSNSYGITRSGTFSLDATNRSWLFSSGAGNNYLDVADIDSTVFSRKGMTVDFEADFGATNSQEPVLDFGRGQSSSNVLILRAGITAELQLHIYNGATFVDDCGVGQNTIQAGLNRYTIAIDGASCKIYVNGTLTHTDNSFTALPPVTTWNSNFIGSSNWNSTFEGKLRSLRVFEGGLTATQTGAVSYRTVSFNSQGGSLTPTALSTSGAIRLPNMGTRAGYDVLGWYTLSGGGSLVGQSGASYSPSGDIELNAQWVMAFQQVGSGACAVLVNSTAGVTVSETVNGACLLQFTAAGSNTLKIPNNVSTMETLIVGAGGGGGAGKYGSSGGGGGGGGGGSSRKATIPVTSSQTIPISVGSGGAGGAVNSISGQDGGDSQLTYGTAAYSSSFVATGGKAGKAPNNWPGGGGIGGSGASAGIYFSSGYSGGNGATHPGDRSYYQPKFGGSGAKHSFAGQTWCVGAGGGGGNREVANDVYFQWEPRSQYCTGSTTATGGSGGWHNGSTAVPASAGLANLGGGGGGGSYDSEALISRAGAAGADGLVAFYFMPSAGNISLSSVAAFSFSATTKSINLTKDNPTTDVTWTSSNTAICTVTGNASSGTVTPVGGGLCEISVTLASSGSFARGTANTSFQIDKISRTAPSWVNGSLTVPFGSTFDLRTNITAPGSNSYVFSTSGTANSCAVTGYTLTVGSVGDSCNVAITLLGDSVYLDMPGATALSIAVSKISQSAIVITSGNTMDVNQSFTVSAAGGSGTGSLSYHVQSQGTTGCAIDSATGALTASSSGTCQIYARRAASTNYDAATSSHQVITVSKIGQILNWVSQPQAQYVAGSTYSLEATASSQLSITYSIASGLCSLSSSIVTFSGSGDCVIQASQSGNGSYLAAATISQTVSVGKINQTMTFSPLSNRSWGSLAFSLSATVSSQLAISYSESAQTTNDACDVSSNGIVTIKNVGDCAVVATQGGNSVYAPVSITRHFEVTANPAGAPFIGSVSFGDRQLNASFFTPSYLGGGTVSAYELRAYQLDGTLASTNTGCIAKSGSTQSCSVIGLTNGQPYVLRVAAITQAGLGALSASSSQIIPAANPEAVSNLIAIEGNGSLRLHWNPATSLGGGNFDQYRIFWRAPGQQYQPNGSPGATIGNQASNSYLITGLQNGVAYDVKVTTVTSINTLELQSNTAEVRQVPFTVPDAPASVVAFDSGTRIVVAWQPPTFDGGNPIDRYVVTKDGSTVCILTSASSTSCELLRPSNGTVNLGVVAENDAGASGAASTSITIVSYLSSVTPVSGSTGGVITAPGNIKPNIIGVTGSSQVKVNSSVRLYGAALDQIKEIKVDGIAASFFVNNAGLITLRIPVGVKPGDPTITLIGDFGSINISSLFEVISTDLPSKSKVTVGTFNGYVAVYTKAHAGKRLSFKIGNTWKVVDQLSSGYTYNLKKLTRNKVATVQVYIDRVLVLVSQVRVK